jgi:hypothetical protein
MELLGKKDIRHILSSVSFFLFLFFFFLSIVCCRAAEFIVYKLKEMGKIDEKDISGIMDEFEQLDYDESGTLTTSDIVLAQTTSQIQR